jgi:hypothetical protein
MLADLLMATYNRGCRATARAIAEQNTELATDGWGKNEFPNVLAELSRKDPDD